MQPKKLVDHLAETLPKVEAETLDEKVGVLEERHWFIRQSRHYHRLR